jgi:hypothetical protein
MFSESRLRRGISPWKAAPMGNVVVVTLENLEAEVLFIGGRFIHAVVNAIRPRRMRASFMVCSLGLFG